MIYTRFLWGLWTRRTCEVSEACLCPAHPLHSPGLDSLPGDRQLIPMSRAFVRIQGRIDTGHVSRQACGFPGLCGRKVNSLRRWFWMISCLLFTGWSGTELKVIIPAGKTAFLCMSQCSEVCRSLEVLHTCNPPTCLFNDFTFFDRIKMYPPCIQQSCFILKKEQLDLDVRRKFHSIEL